MSAEPVLFAGLPEAFGEGSRSAIVKVPVQSVVWLSAAGLDADEQADRSHHGGADRALCHYPVEHLAYWRERYPDRAPAFVPGAFGENLSVSGWQEVEVGIGDVFRLGETLIQVTQPRQPCWKVNTRFAIDELSRAMVETRRSGWLYRVLEPGEVAPGAALERVERDAAGLSLQRLWVITLDARESPERLLETADHPALAAAWRLRLRSRAEWLLKGRRRR